MSLPSPVRAGSQSAWTAPALVGAGVAAATAVVAVVSPEEPGAYPACPFHAVTGWWCPGCGSLRAVHALTHGDVPTAIDRNVLLVLAVPVLVLAWAAWLRRTVTGRPGEGLVRADVISTDNVRRRVPAAAGWVLLATVGAFWVLRNVPAGSWLAP